MARPIIFPLHGPNLGGTPQGVPALLFGQLPLQSQSAPVSFAYVGSGGLTFAGAASVVKEKIGATSGGLVFAGSGAIAKSKIVTPSGGLVFGGTATVTRGFVPQIAGGIVFSGLAATQFVSGAQPSSGGGGEKVRTLLVRGEVFPRARFYVSSGGITFGGSAEVEFEQVPRTHEYVGSGALRARWRGSAQSQVARPNRYVARIVGARVGFGGHADASRTRGPFVVADGIGDVPSLVVKKGKGFIVKR